MRLLHKKNKRIYLDPFSSSAVVCDMHTIPAIT